MTSPSDSLSYVAAFRAYKWNADIAFLAARFFANCPGARHVVLVNEERGEIDVGLYEKVSHTQDFGAFGLPERPAGQSPWYNSDYTYLLLRIRLPGYGHYLIVESDVAVNLSVEPIIRHVAEQRIDALVHQMTSVHPDWVHYEASLAQDDPLRCFLFVCIFSEKALEVLLTGRQVLASHPSFEERPWPICESFVPTVLRDAGLRIAELSPFLEDASLLRYRPFLRLADPETSRPGTMAHPVLGPTDLATALLYDQSPTDFFQEGTVLQGHLAQEPLASIATPLIDSFARTGDHRPVARLHAELRRHGVPFPHRADLAFAKPAIINAASQWSRAGDPVLDACGANGSVLHEECAFHTDDRIDAWWQVDLLDDCMINRVEIVNRGNFSERFQNFSISGSTDGWNWITRHVELRDTPVSSDAANPWSHHFETPFRARFVRVCRVGETGVLHLRRVRVFGHVIYG